MEEYLTSEIGIEDLSEEIGEEAAEAVPRSEKQLSQAEDLAGELLKL